MTIAGYSMTLMTLLVGAAGALWLLTIAIALISWEGRPKSRRLRKAELAALAATLVFGFLWPYAFLRATPSMVVEATKESKPCSLIAVGDTEARVKERIGEPDQIRGEEEIRGPASDVWIYQQTRCAVHFFGDTVESIE